MDIRPLLLAYLLLPLSTLAHSQSLDIPETVRFLALGDSYTIGQGVPQAQSWPFQFRDSLIERGFLVDTLAVIATTGWTTVNLMDAISSKGLKQKDFNMVSLLIGVNDQFQGKPLDLYRPRLEALIDSALQFIDQDTQRLFVVSIPDYAYTPFGQNFNPGKITSEIDLYNAVNQLVASEYGIPWFNVTPISRQGLDEPELVAPDNLHPSAIQYTRWVELILESVNAPVVGTSVPDMDHSLTIWPNPSSGLCSIQWTGFGACEIKILDASGRPAYAPLRIPSQGTVSVSLSAGMYVVSGTTPRGNIPTQQIIIIENQ